MGADIDDTKGIVPTFGTISTAEGLYGFDSGAGNNTRKEFSVKTTGTYFLKNAEQFGHQGTRSHGGENRVDRAPRPEATLKGGDTCVAPFSFPELQSKGPFEKEPGQSPRDGPTRPAAGERMITEDPGGRPFRPDESTPPASLRPR